MKGLKKGLGIYLILFFAMFCGIIWYMNKNSKTDSGYTIVDFQAEVSEDLIGSVEIYQNKEIPTGTVYITYRQTNEEKEFYVSDVNKVQQIIMSKGNGNIRLELHDVSGQSNVWTWLPTVVLIVVLLVVVMIFMANMSGAGGGGGAGGGIQRGERGAAAVPDHHVRGILDGVDGGRAFSAAAGGGDGDLTAPFRGGEDIAVQLPVGGLQVVVIVLVHGDVVGVYGGGGDLYLAARQNVGVVRLDVEVAQFAGGLIGGHQEQVVGHRPLTAVGGAVDGSGGGVVGLRHGDGGGAAAVQADGGHAAQLDHPLGHLAQAGADGVAGPAAVDGIEHHGAVSCHTYRRAGVHPGGQTGDHGAVLHQGV